MTADTTERWKDFRRQDFWRETFPQLHINQAVNEPFANRVLRRPLPKTMAVNAERMREDGYFQDRDETIKRLAPALADAARTCRRLDIPPTFLFLFDEPWKCFFSLHNVIEHFLGDYRVLPDFWIWYVEPQAAEAGWRPHRDKGYKSLGPNGEPLSLSLWIPLSEATPLSSCVYILPKGLDPIYGTDGDGTDNCQWQVDFPSIRALTASPGDYLCWDQALLHWGSASSRFADGPRISMALEVQRSDAAPMNDPLLPPFANVDFTSRLWLVAKQILQFRHMYLVRPELEEFALSVVNPQGAAA